MICKDCKYLIDFLSQAACEVGVPWVKTIKKTDKACKYFRPKEEKKEK